MSARRRATGRDRTHLQPGRPRHVKLRYTEAEYAAVAEAARASGLTPTGYAAEAALAAAQGLDAPSMAPLREALLELMAARGQVRRFGVNVNQAVRELNATGEAPSLLVQAVALTSRAVSQLGAGGQHGGVDQPQPPGSVRDLLDLARTARGGQPPRRRARPKQLRPSLQHMLDAMTAVPAFIANGRLDIVGTNALARAFYTLVLESPAKPTNFARFCFLDPTAHEFYPAWERAADTTVAMLRTEAGRDPHNRALTDLIGELATRSDAIRTRWASHDVHVHVTGSKTFRHPVVGELQLAFNAIPLPGDPGLSLTVYTPEPGTGTDEQLALLASWAATPAAARRTPTPEQA